MMECQKQCYGIAAMTQEKIQDQVCETKLSTPGKKYFLLLILAAGVLVLLVLWHFYGRLEARINRVLASSDLGRLPHSAESLIIDKKKDGFFSTRVIFIGFDASETDIINFINNSLSSTADEPGSLASFHLGPELSSWTKWDNTADARVYHFDRSNTSIWLVVDGQSNAIYLYMFLHNPEWLYKLRKYLP
jgi:hypothetical protein